MVDCPSSVDRVGPRQAVQVEPNGTARATAESNPRIEAFIAWANAQAATHGLLGETIPPDPNGAIGTARFRRSLAWHVPRRPNGLVALAIQYGHLRTAVAGSYAARSRGGIQDLIDIETARAVADLHDGLGAGGDMSGPAARRAIKAAATAPRFAGTVITAIAARRLVANEDAMIYDMDTRAARVPGPLGERLRGAPTSFGATPPPTTAPASP